MTRRLAAAFVVLATCSLAGQAPAPASPPAKPVSAKDTASLNLTAYAELLRSDVRTQKVAILTEIMAFTPDEDKAFWPIYREYDREMSALGDERVALIAEYADNFAKITDPLAETLATRAIDLDSRRRATLAKYYGQVKAALSPRTALRFLQVEHQLLLLIDLQIASALPIVESGVSQP